MAYDFDLSAEPPDAWRRFDVLRPDPAYHDFDWLSARYPDLYHRFAQSTDGLIAELEGLVDLTGKTVLDVGAGTGRSAKAVARRATRVFALDAFSSVVEFGSRTVRDTGVVNVDYVRGHRSFLPFPNSSIDVVIASWAELDYEEAYRVLKPGGHIAHMACVPGTVCGEVTVLLNRTGLPGVNWLTAGPPVPQPHARWFERDFAAEDTTVREVPGSVPLLDGLLLHDFTTVVDFGSVAEAAAIVHRLWGPLAAQYLLYRKQSSVAWRQRIACGRVAK